MAEDGFFSRLANLWGGFLSLFVGNIEKDNPEAVYEAAINERKRKYKELKKAVSGVIVLRNKLQTELEEKSARSAELDAQIAAAVDQEEDEVALVLLSEKEELDSRLAELDRDLQRAKEEAESAKESIVSFQAEIEKLEREKVQMLARKEHAEARIQIQDTLSGMSMEADIKALDNVRQNISQLQAEASVGSELADAEIGGKLRTIKKQASTATARAKLEALKRAREADKASVGAQAASVKKSI